VARHRLHRLNRALHQVAPTTAMNVDIDHARQHGVGTRIDIGRLDVKWLAIIKGFPGSDAPALYHQRHIPIELTIRHQLPTEDPKPSHQPRLYPS
jgi:hypothetical protein